MKIHLSCDAGEIIDLYGLCIIDGVYHIFCLYKTESHTKKWGHFSTKDFLEYEFFCGDADITEYKISGARYFANTNGEALMMELIKSPTKSRKSFFSLPRRVVTGNEITLQYPSSHLEELREYKRTLVIKENESADTFGSIFEGIFTFSADVYSLRLRDGLTVTCNKGSFAVEYESLTQSFEATEYDTVHIFSDTFSVEIFAGGRFLSLPVEDDKKGTVTVTKGQCRAEIYKLKNIVIK